MRRLAYVAFCLAAMTALWYLCKFLITGVSEDFGNGVLVGTLFGALIGYGIRYFDERERLYPDDP